MYYDGISPKRNIAAANKLARDGIKFVIGHPFSDCAVPASDVYEDKRVLMISPAATSPELTAHGHRLTFRTVGTDDVQEQVLRCVIGVCKFNYSLFFFSEGRHSSRSRYLCCCV
jgi:ABC-type branched-subunit amino acid transport system substrate-binding protein